MAKGFVQGGVLTLRLLEAEPAHQAQGKGQVRCGTVVSACLCVCWYGRRGSGRCVRDKCTSHRISNRLECASQSVCEKRCNGPLSEPGTALPIHFISSNQTKQAAYTSYLFRIYWGPELPHAKAWLVRRR